MRGRGRGGRLGCVLCSLCHRSLFGVDFQTAWSTGTIVVFGGGRTGGGGGGDLLHGSRTKKIANHGAQK